jgi:hypothetical protein
MTARFQDAQNLRKPPAFQIVGQVVDSQPTEDDIEGRLREGKFLNQAHIENNLQP